MRGYLGIVASAVISTFGAWVARSAQVRWSNIDCSSDGLKGIAVTTGVGSAPLIYLTSDAGATWSPCAISGVFWHGCAISPDGSFLVALGDSNINACNLYTSTDFGLNWIKRTTGLFIVDVCLNTNGSKIIYAANTIAAPMSTDFGVSFNPSGYAGTGKVVSCACSDDFTKIILGTHWNAINANDFLYVSTNSGASFSAKGASGLFDAVECSGNGAVMLASDSMAGTKYSKNTGTTWANTPLDIFYGAGISSDGTKLVVPSGFFGEYFLYYSFDSGDSWIGDTTAPALASARCSGDFGTWMGSPKYGVVDFLYTRLVLTLLINELIKNKLNDFFVIY